jgi:hypothetical protein
MVSRIPRSGKVLLVASSSTLRPWVPRGCLPRKLLYRVGLNMVYAELEVMASLLLAQSNISSMLLSYVEKK